MQIQGRVLPRAGFSVWFGTVAIIGGVFLSLAGLFRYRKTKHQLEFGRFEPAGFLVDLIGILTALLGLALAGYLVYIELSL
jgi:LPXTG-motif cell wall-anchored protein